MIKALIEGQLNLLRERLWEEGSDPALIAEQAETILLYAQVLRDFPELPELLRTRYPEPPPSFQPAFRRDDSDGLADELCAGIRRPQADEI